MRIGIISNTDTFIPFAYTLAGQGLQVYLFFSPSPDAFVNQKVQAFAAQFNIACTEEKNGQDELYNWLINGKFDVCFMLGYGQLIRLDRLKQCPTPIFNIHFGLLPYFRGPVPVFWQLKSGRDKIGLTIHRLTEKFDAGPIVWIKETDNLPHYNYELSNQLFGQLCVEGVIHIIRHLSMGLQLPQQAQRQVPGGYQKRPGAADIIINWKTMGAEDICNLVRACNPWNKGATTLFNNQEVKLVDGRAIPGDSGDAEPGTIVNIGTDLEIACTNCKLIAVNMLYCGSSFIAAYQARLFGFTAGQKFNT